MNLGNFLSATAERLPKQPAVTYAARTFTYGELNERVNSLVAAFREQGAVPGDRVAFITANRPEVLEILFASFKCGLCAVPLNASFVQDEVAYHVNDSRARFLVYGPEQAEKLVPLGERLPSVHHFVALDAAERVKGSAPVHDYERLVVAHRDADERPWEVSDEDVCWLFYTSGTTGRPKGAMLTHGNLVYVVLSWLADLMPLNIDDVTLHVAPLTHGAGFHAIAATAAGAHQIIAEGARFDPERVLDLITSKSVTNIWMVPTQVIRLVRGQRRLGRDLSSLHCILYGGAPFHLADLREAIEVLGPVLLQVYAQGETPMTATYLPQREHLAVDQEVLSSAGYARRGMEVSIHDQDDRQLPRGDVGEIVVRGPTVMKGYWELPAESQEALRGGWLHTGDLGRIDDRGYLYILDRMKDLIITGGSNVYAREVEAVLLTHPDVAAAAVFGISDPEWGERVVAAIVPRDTLAGIDTEQLKAHCRHHMAPYKRPKEFHAVSELPVSAYGKVLKNELRRRFAEQELASQ